MTGTDQLILLDHHTNTINKYDPNLTLIKSITSRTYPFRTQKLNDKIVLTTTGESPLSLVIYDNNLNLIYENTYHINSIVVFTHLLKANLLLLVLHNSIKLLNLDNATQKQLCKFDGYTIPYVFSLLEMDNKSFIFIQSCDRQKTLYQLSDTLTPVKMPWVFPFPDEYLSRAVRSAGVSNNQNRLICVYQRNEKDCFYILYDDTYEEISFPQISIHIAMNYCYDPYIDSLIIVTISDNKCVLYLLKEHKDRKWKLMNMKVYKIEYKMNTRPGIDINYDNIIIDHETIFIINKYNLEIIHQIKNQNYIIVDSLWQQHLSQLLLNHPALHKMSKSLIGLILSYVVEN